MQCRACTKELAENFRFCPECGGKAIRSWKETVRSWKNTSRSAELMPCPSCDSTIEKKAWHCPNCGERMVARSETIKVTILTAWSAIGLIVGFVRACM